ncbi:thioredoxin family protein [Streptomyces sp. NPDC093225]|uniref:thioredoxin family protein n=1 Tax=Streptomyces sp. NPDC093225 TaxID=3366034 RepID=UPI00380AD492
MPDARVEGQSAGLRPGRSSSRREYPALRVCCPRRYGSIRRERLSVGERGAGKVHPEGEGRVRLGEAELGARRGERATLVQFSSAFCQPCRATRRILGEVADLVPGVAHVEIDAEARLELVRALGIAKTPTVLVLDAAGAEVRRAAGMPRKADVIAALGAVL